MEDDQAIEIKTVLSNRETTSICQDWMVGDAGIEPANLSLMRS
jgi:hypothetical protein